MARAISVASSLRSGVLDFAIHSYNLAEKMEIYYEPDERIIATKIPSFNSKRKTPQIQIRSSEGGEVVRREFRRAGLEQKKVAENRSRISPDEVDKLIRQVVGLMKLSDTMPAIDDSGSREIALHHEDGTHETVLLSSGGGRKHPAKKPFDDAWRAIEASTKSNSERTGDVQPATAVESKAD